MSATFQGGEKIYLQAGQEFKGRLPLKGGDLNNRTTVKKYGTGSNPIISGTIAANTLTWTQNGNVWSATHATRVGRVIRSGIAERTAQSNFYTVTAKPDSTHIVASSATGLSNVTEMEMISKEFDFRWTYNTITAYNSGTGNFTVDRANNILAGFQFRLFNHPSLIAADGDWAWRNGVIYYRSPGNVNPSTLNVELSVHEEGIYLETGSSNYLIQGVNFNGQSLDGVYGFNVSNVSIESFNCTNQLNSGISLFGNCANTNIKDGVISKTGSNGIFNGLTNGYEYSNLTIYDIGMGFDPPFIRSNARYNVSYRNGAVTLNNTGTTGVAIFDAQNSANGIVDAVTAYNLAYGGILSFTNGMEMSNCTVSDCLKRSNDGAGIYTGQHAAYYGTDDFGSNYGWTLIENFNVTNCQVYDAIGNLEGVTVAAEIFAGGVYFDHGVYNSSVIDCNVHDNNGFGIVFNFYTRNNTARGNTAINNKEDIRLSNWLAYNQPSSQGHIVEDNILTALASNQRCIAVFDYESGGFNPFAFGGRCQNNVCHSPNNLLRRTVSTNVVTELTLAQAQATYGQTFGTQQNN